MAYSVDELNCVYDKTGRYCYHCGKKLAFINYGIYGAMGAWEVDHSRSKREGGSNYYRNLVPSCISCNRSKGALHSRQFRRYFE